MKFLDEAKVWIRSGAGGPGSVSFRREKFIEYGGPDGGDGGAGGDVWAECVDGSEHAGRLSLSEAFQGRRNGQGGMGKGRTGKDGDDVVLKLPAGHRGDRRGKRRDLIADLTEVGQRALAG